MSILMDDLCQGKETLQIEDRAYKFETPPFSKARKVLAFSGKMYSSNPSGLTASADEQSALLISYLDDEYFINEIDPIVKDFITLNGVQLSKMPNHFDKHRGDYLQLVTVGIMVFTHPFLKGVSQS